MRWLGLVWLILGVAAAQDHPRILFPPAMEAGVKQRIASDELAAGLQKRVLDRAEKSLKERTCEYRIPDGKRLLSESRMALHQVLVNAWAWRTSGDVRFRDRVIRELDAACALKDWNPSHFLDTAEMATAVSIGYDWLYPSLSEEQRKRYEDALLDRALRTVLKVHGRAPWWTGPGNNWSQVCGTGMTLAALAVRERDPGLCDGIIEHGIELLNHCREFYEPDGAYPEGPGYWHYGTNYHILGIAACKGLKRPIETPRVLGKSGSFMLHIVGPSGLPFNYADGGVGQELASAAQSWLASEFHDSTQAEQVRDSLARGLKRGVGNSTTGELRFFPLHLLWLPSASSGSPDKELAATFQGEQAFAMLRTTTQPDAAWLAIKGGTGAASHGHLDAGSFVYDAAGIRWFHDLGSDDYNMPGYFGKQRWDYLRLNNFSHNTLVVNGKNQAAPKIGCPVEPWKTVGPNRETRIDLSTAYEGQAEKVLRRVVMDPKSGAVSLFDTLTKPTGEVRWAVVTKAKPKIDGSRLILEEGGRKLVLTRVDRSGGAWQEFSLKPKSDQEKKNDGYRILGFTAPAAENLGLQVIWRLE